MLLASARTATLARCAKVLGSLVVIASLCGCEMSRQDHLVEARTALADAAYDEALAAAEAGLRAAAVGSPGSTTALESKPPTPLRHRLGTLSTSSPIW